MNVVGLLSIVLILTVVIVLISMRKQKEHFYSEASDTQKEKRRESEYMDDMEQQIYAQLEQTTAEEPISEEPTAETAEIINDKQKPNVPHNWKSDNDYWKIDANNLNLNEHTLFNKEVVLNSQRVQFNNPTYFNNDIYLHGNSLKFNTLKDIKMNEEVYKNNILYVNELNSVFSDEMYSLEQDDEEELNQIGLTKLFKDKQECDYFNKTKDDDSCKEKMWRALRKKEISPDPVCNCCCSPDSDLSNCIVQLIKSDNKDATVLQLKMKGHIIYSVSNTQTNDDIIHISLQKSNDIKNCKLMFYNVEKKMQDDDDEGLVRIMFQDEFEANIVEYPNGLGIKSIKLIIE